MTPKRSDDYSVLKALTVILVVLGHVTIFYSSFGGAILYPVNKTLDLVTRWIYLFHMQLFMFLSGAVYQACIQAGKYRSLPSFLLNKGKRLLVPYFTFGALNVAPVMILLGISRDTYFGYFLRGIVLCDNNRHLWFLITLFAIFVIVRLLKPLFDRLPWSLWVVFAGSLALLTISIRFPSRFSLYNITRMLGFFLAGYLYDRYKTQLSSLIRNAWPLALAAFGSTLYFLWRGTGPVTTQIAAFCGIWAALFLARRLPEGFRESKPLRFLGKNAMGIYLFHPMYNYCIFWMLKPLGLHPLMQTGIAFSSILILSWLSTAGMRKLNLRFLLGE